MLSKEEFYSLRMEAKKVLVREISKTSPAGKEHTVERNVRKEKLQQIATFKIAFHDNSIPRGEKKKTGSDVCGACGRF
jgi:hypothetical protein